MKALSVKVNLEQGNVKFPPSFPLPVGFIGAFPAEGPAPRGWQRGRTKGRKGRGPPSQSAASVGVSREATPPWSFPSGMGSGNDAFLCSLQPIPNQVEAGKKQGDRRGVRKGEAGLLGPSLWSGRTPLPQLLDKGFNDFLFHFLQFLLHLFQKLLFHPL